MKAECLHVTVVDDVETQVEQCLVLAVVRFEQGTYVELEFLQYSLVDDAVAVYEVAEQLVFVDGLKVQVAHFYRACA